MFNRTVWTASACAAIVSGAGGAGAQTAPAEIVVTAPSASDSVLIGDTPVNAQVLTGNAFTQAHPATLADLLDASLGSVSVSNGTGNAYQNDVSYRGFSATSLLGSPTGLSVWLDGVRMNEPFGAVVNWDLIPLNAIAAVEVLPGSNPLFGLNTLGGALVLTTKNGVSNPGAAVTVSGGSYARRAIQGEAGGTAANGTIDWFVAGNYDDQDGYRWFTHTRVAQGYGKLRWQGAASHAALSAIWADTSLAGTQGLPLSMLAMPKTAYTWPDTIANNQAIINLAVDTQVSPALKLSGNVYYRQSDQRSVNSNASLGDNCDGVTYDCSALAPGGTARDLLRHNPYLPGSAAQAAFVAYDGPLPIHDYTSGIETTLVTSRIVQHTVGGNVLLDWDGRFADVTHDVNLGGSFELSTVRYGQDTGLAALVNYQTVPLAANPLYAGAAAGGASPLINRVAIAAQNRSANLFVRDHVTLSRTLGLTASLSYTLTRVSLTGTNTTLLDGSGGYTWAGDDGRTYYNPGYLGLRYWQVAGGTLATATVPEGAIAGPQVEPVAGGHSYHRLNPSVGLTWNPVASLGLFASYAQAMRAPTAIELACADPDRPCSLPTGFNGDPALQAVVARGVELGARGTIARVVHWNAAVYRTAVANDILFVFNASGLGHFANFGHTLRTGGELGVAARVARFDLAASYGYVAATYRDRFTDANGATVNPGSHIAGIPAQSLKLHAAWQPVRAVTLGLGMIAVSRQFAHGDEANRNPAVPGYALVNGDLHLTPCPGVELFGTVTNLTDVHYATFGVLGTNIYTGQDEQFRTPAPGRTLLIGARLAFGAAKREPN